VQLTILLVCLADIACQIRADLCANAHAVTNFDSLNFAARLDHSANDLVTNTKRHWGLTPSARDCVDIATTDSASVNGDIDVILLEGLQLELERR